MSDALLATAAAALLAPDLPPPALRGPPDAFDVHRNTVIHALVQAQADGAPVTRAVLGADCFAALARERVRLDPPRSPVLATYISGLGDFIARAMPIAWLPWLGDLARLEAALVEALHAADATPMPHGAWHALLADADALQHARLVLHPACRWLRSAHAVGSLWRAHQGADVDGALAALDIARPEQVLVARPAYDVEVHVLPPGGADLLDALAAGRPLGQAIALALAADARADAADLFAMLVATQATVALDPSRSTP